MDGWRSCRSTVFSEVVAEVEATAHIRIPNMNERPFILAAPVRTSVAWAPVVIRLALYPNPRIYHF